MCPIYSQVYTDTVLLLSALMWYREAFSVQVQIPFQIYSFFKLNNVFVIVNPLYQQST